MFLLYSYFFESLRLPLAKGSSTFLTKPLFPQGREDVTALRCSEPLRSKVWRTIKGLRQILRDGTALLQTYTIRLFDAYLLSVSLKYNFIMKGAFFDNSFRSILLNQVINKFSTLFRYIWAQCYFKLIKYIVL